MTDKLTTAEAAAILKLSPGFITSHLLQPGILPAEKVNGRWFIDRAAVEAYQKPEPKSTRPHVVQKGQQAIFGWVSQAELAENRAKLARVTEEAATAVFLDMNGGRKIVERVKG